MCYLANTVKLLQYPYILITRYCQPRHMQISLNGLLLFQVQLGVFVTYAKALGVPYAFFMLLLFASYQAISVFGNVWLSQWTADPTLTNRSLPANSSVYRERNDYYLGIYGGTGAALGNKILISESRMNL